MNLFTLIQYIFYKRFNMKTNFINENSKLWNINEHYQNAKKKYKS